MRERNSHGGQAVRLNVYDLSEQNGFLYWCGLGVYHSGVEVYGMEFAYGGHDYNTSGIFATKPREAPGDVQFRTSILLGYTDLPREGVQQLVRRMGKYYKGNKYHLLQRNCNHFSSDLCHQLARKRPPFWVNRLAGLAVMLHCLLPHGWVPALETPTMLPVDDDEPRSPVAEQKTLLRGHTRSDDVDDNIDRRVGVRV
eukprot:TRINITY_DN2118_c0_g1_i6.p2 TRINITY_DN2118_c0_g1~~TRINITY_DN2118_c0_g1_i6.p2  ORF type:complete len:198 (-),score=22.20 TRINITY_DN2118_c0_g1_i6:852-1445(-)